MVKSLSHYRGLKFNHSFSREVDLFLEEKPDAIVVVGSYQASAAFIRDLRQKNTDIWVANLSFVGAESLLQLLNAESLKSGKELSHRLVFSQVIPNIETSSLKAAKEFRLLVERSNKPVSANYVSFEGFLNAKLLVESLNRVPKPFNRQALQRVSRSLDNVDLGLKRKVSFRKSNQASNDVYLLTVKGDRFKPAEDLK